MGTEGGMGGGGGGAFTASEGQLYQQEAGGSV